MPVTVTDDGDSEGGQTFEHYELVFAESIGVNLEEECAPELLQLVVRALYTLPSEWEIKTTEYAQLDGLPFFCNTATQQSQWTHPHEEEIKQLVRERRNQLLTHKESRRREGEASLADEQTKTDTLTSTDATQSSKEEETDKRLLTLASGMDIFFSPSPSDGSVQEGGAMSSSSPFTRSEENACCDRIEEKPGPIVKSTSQEYRSIASKAFVDTLCGAALEKTISSAPATANSSPDVEAQDTSASINGLNSSSKVIKPEDSLFDKKAMVGAIFGAAVENVVKAEGVLPSSIPVSPDVAPTASKQTLVIPEELSAPPLPEVEETKFTQPKENSIVKTSLTTDDFFHVDPALLRRCVDHVDQKDLAGNNQRECIDIERLYHSRTTRECEDSTNDLPPQDESTKMIVAQSEEKNFPSSGEEPQSRTEMIYSACDAFHSTETNSQVNEKSATSTLPNESSSKASHGLTMDHERILPNDENDKGQSDRPESIADKESSETAFSTLRSPQTDQELRTKRLSVIANSKSSVKIKFHDKRSRFLSAKNKRKSSSSKETDEKSWVLLGAFGKYHEAVTAAKNFESSFPSRFVPSCSVVGKSFRFSSKQPDATSSAAKTSFSALSLNSPINSQTLQLSVKGDIPQLRITRDLSRMQWLVECDADPRGHARTTFSQKIVTSKRTFSPLKTASGSGRAYSLPPSDGSNADLDSRSPDHAAITTKAPITTAPHPVVAPKLSALKASFSPRSMLSSSNSLHLSSQVPVVYKSSSVRSHSSHKSSTPSLAQKRKSFNSGRLSMLPEHSFSTFGADFSGRHVTSTKRPSSPKTFRQALASLSK